MEAFLADASPSFSFKYLSRQGSPASEFDTLRGGGSLKAPA